MAAGVAPGQEFTVEDFDGSIGELDHTKVVSDHDPGLATALDFGPEELHNLRSEFGVQRSGRLVDKNQIRIGHQRSPDGHTLPLPPGELLGQIVAPFDEPKLPQ